jgi:hypothetical protein
MPCGKGKHLLTVCDFPGAATTAVIAAMDDVAIVTRDLIISEEGKRYIEKTLKETTVQVQRSFEEILERTKKRD